MIFGQQSSASQGCLMFQALHLLLWAHERMMVIDSISLLLLRWLWIPFSPNPLCWYNPQHVILLLWWLEAQRQRREEEQALSDCDGAGVGGVTGVLRWDSVTELKLTQLNINGHSEFTFPWLIWYTKAVAACKGGCKQQAAGGEIILSFGGVGGAVKTELGYCATEPAVLLRLWFFIFGVGVSGSKLPVCTDWNQY